MPFANLSPKEIFNGMSFEEANTFFDKIKALDPDGPDIVSTGLRPSQFKYILKVLPLKLRRLKH